MNISQSHVSKYSETSPVEIRLLSKSMCESSYYEYNVGDDLAAQLLLLSPKFA